MSFRIKPTEICYLEVRMLYDVTCVIHFKQYCAKINISIYIGHLHYNFGCIGSWCLISLLEDYAHNHPCRLPEDLLPKTLKAT